MINSNMNQLPSLTGLKLLTPATSFSEDPKVSSDGKTIAYVSDRAEAGNIDVWIQRLPDGAPKRITADAGYRRKPSCLSLMDISSHSNPLVIHPGIYLVT